jgi:GNAT superfamily N-acetyltransferase
MHEGMIGFSIDLRELPRYEPDERVRPVARGDDLGRRASVTRAAFRVDKPFHRYVREYEAFTRSPAYPEGWDLVAWAEPGVAAACTIAWPDPVSLVGSFEPVATHPDLQRQGFASAVVRDGLRRLRDAGMERANVCTVIDNHGAIALYRSLGFRDDYIQRWYARS